MNLHINPGPEEWPALVQRPYEDSTAVQESVQLILNAVRQHGDEALWSFTKKFDGVELTSFSVSADEMEAAAGQLSTELKEAIQQAARNIESFHRSQLHEGDIVETMPGVRCWRRSVGIEKVGLYVPGGTAPLFSTVLMLGIPARLAGCGNIILCTPCNAEGCVHPAVLYAASLVGIQRIFKLGGAQAIAAMAYGTETVPTVYKLFGPGNQYVTMAKQLVQQRGIAIDMPAGPSEVCVLADDSAMPAFVAADLLSQAEHGPDSQVLLVCYSEDMARRCMNEVARQLEQLPRRAIAEKSMANSRAVVLGSEEEALALVNAYAAEHLILCCRDAEAVAGKITNAGSVFLGHYSPESVGDYASGTNHTLPTNGFARAFSGVSVDSFVRKITFQQLSREGLQQIASTVTTLALNEGLEGHARAVTVRLEESFYESSTGTQPVQHEF